MVAAEVEVSVSDPSDWLPTSLSSFATLETALRCQVCKEFYDTPMITSCSHTFCSLCIRRCLSADGKCPTCRTEDQSSKLRRNWTVQECVDAFTNSRKQALELATVKEEDEHLKRKRRKLDTAHGGSQSNTSPTTRQTRSSVRRGGQNSIPASQEIIAIDSEDEGDAEFLPEAESEPQEPDDGLVACPMCSKRMKEEAVFSHLDRCDGKSTPPPAKPKLPQPKALNPPSRTASPAKHLPHLNYSLLKDGPLKKKLQELGIPTWGNRQLLIRRHTQWVDIYNANTDSPRPKPERQLLRDLDVWERTQGGHAPGQGQTGPVGVMRKDFDGGEWTGKHKDQFSDLIAQARARARQKAASIEERKDPAEEKPADAMEGVTASEPSQTAGDSASAAPTKIDTTVKPAIPDSSASASQEIDASPLASMIHSAAQDVRRQSSISHSPARTVPGLISMHSINDHSAAPAPHTSNQQVPAMTNGSSHGHTNEDHQPKPLVPSLPQEDSLQEKLAAAASESVTQGEGAKMKTVDMFRVPESPINDVEGLGTATGGG